ncbi:hypothetical protein [Afipia birgiae]|uniref:hypothetical protein n=1 Tax=Afipia birgiae TaxID=151414 RepID=UPI0012EBDBE7|nr:hypothetical protein [Afipia birgiae]
MFPQQMVGYYFLDMYQKLQLIIEKHGNGIFIIGGNLPSILAMQRVVSAQSLM